MKEIPLTRGLYAIVDDEDYDRVMQYRWRANHNPTADTYYALTNCPRTETGKRPQLRMHRIIMDAPPGIDVDHIDGNGLNNTRSNLRLCSSRQNAQNRPKARGRDKHSMFKGVRRIGSRWVARITVNSRPIKIGTYSLELDAARAYDSAARLHFGEYARTNGV